jgi:hypothetical protein
VGDESQAIWSLIRETRARRPGKAADHPKRAEVYGAALQQFEELMRAARSVGYASRPLPLFYAISQAGRAITAAWADQPWELHGHGLKFEKGPTAFRSIVKPEPKATSSFQSVATVVHQGVVGLTGGVELGALWASLPDLNPQDLRDERWRRPLIVLHELEDPATSRVRGKYVIAEIGIAADRWKHLRMLNESLSDNELDAEFEALMRHYPTAEGWQHYRPQGLRLVDFGYFGPKFTIYWQADSATLGAREWAFVHHAFEHRVSGTWWIRPDLNEAGDFLWPLMTWWTLLYGLSMLARYHPGEWTSALRVDDSPETVPLEAALDVALEVVPHFVLEGLRAEQFTVPA